MIEVEIDKSVYLPCYQHLLDDDDTDIQLIWGGRDSGKSKFVAQYLTEQSMTLDYFRCLLIKETHESIKDAQWQMIKDTTEQWNVDSLFKFISSPLSIKCVNNNTFATRGMDNPAKVRSFSNPSHAWIEEGNQISEEAFITIITGLRSDYGRVKMIFTFNPESTNPDFREFWLYKMFFSKHEPLQSFTGEIAVKNPRTQENEVLRYRSTHTTYHDNPYVSGQRIAFHESLKETNYYWYKVFTLGEWGQRENDSPFFYAFDRQKHVGTCSLNRAYPLYLSWDFNRNPISCLAIQHYESHVFVIEAIKLPKSGVDAVCDYIKTYYPGCLYIVTGDYSGNTETSLFKEQVTHYSLIKSYLNLSDGQIKIRPNPRLEKNATLVNTILHYYKVTIDAGKSKGLIFDMENAKKRADGTIVKDDRNDPAQQVDLGDCFRYFCNIFLDWFKPTL